MRPEPKKICAATQGLLLLLNWRSWRLPNRAYSLTSQGYHSNQRPLSDQAINIRKTMSTDDKKTSPAPKNGAVEKKAVAAKKDEGQPKDKTTPDADRSKAESGEKAAVTHRLQSGRGPKTRFKSI
jgi:hypothetical protein